MSSEYKYVSSLVVMNSSPILVAPIAENLIDFYSDSCLPF
jgi:hypothetical protein